MNEYAVEIYAGPDTEMGGSKLYVTFVDDGDYPLVDVHTMGTPYGTGYGGITTDDWLRWAKRVGAGHGLSWVEAEATMKPYGWSPGGNLAPQGMRAFSTIKSRH